MPARILFKALFAILVIMLLNGCGSQQLRSKSSVVDYLYPTGKEKIISPSVPHLNIPLNVGVAFVPSESPSSSGFNWWRGRVTRGNFDEAKKTILLDKIAEHFKNYKFINNIEVIPSAYLTPGGSFTNLKQIKTMYGIDVIALVSYDQAQFTDEGALSLTYWTLIGAYIVAGEKNDTSTLMDTAVFDIVSKKMLFRAPGVSQVKGHSTAINLSEELRVDSEKGFQLATDDMISNLDVQLKRFKDKLKASLEEKENGKAPVATVTYKESYKGGGGGSMDIFEVIFLLAFAVMRYRNINIKIGRQ